MNHSDIWRAIEKLAKNHGLSTSGLARRAGLDPTTFNPSKRLSPEGRDRWPSTESISKILIATDTSLSEFTALVNQRADDDHYGRPFPLIGFAQAGEGGYFDDAGFPVGGAWDAVDLPEISDTHAYALQIQGASFEPVYREGDIIVASPGASIRRGDRVVLRTRDKHLMVRLLSHRGARRIGLKQLDPAGGESTIAAIDIEWMHRIVWASQ